MIEKSNLIEKVYLTLRQVSKYNDNSNKYRTIVEKLLENVVDEVAHSNSFQFNQTKQKLTKFKAEKNEFDEWTYNIPPKLLNVVAPGNLRIENEFIISQEDDLWITYNYKVELLDMPEYLINYLRFKLCYELSLSYSQFADRSEEFYYAVAEEERKLKLNELPEARDYTTDWIREW